MRLRTFSPNKVTQFYLCILVGLCLTRFISQAFFAVSVNYPTANERFINDSFHHYYLGLVVLILAFLLRKNAKASMLAGFGLGIVLEELPVVLDDLGMQGLRFFYLNGIDFVLIAGGILVLVVLTLLRKPDVARLTDQRLAQIIWDFNTQLNAPIKSDIILVLGSHDLRVADRGIELFKAGYAPLLLFSGNVGKLTKGLWGKPEAEVFAERALKQGVPAEKVLIENKSGNTGENIAFSLKLLKQKDLHPTSFLLVQKPHMLQRTLATFRKYVPAMKVSLACPNISLEDYPDEVVKRDSLISTMVGYVQRLHLYSEKGFQVPVEIPVEVEEAYRELIKRGYTTHLVK